MCLAIVVSINSDIDHLYQSIENAWSDNPDGGGYAYVGDGGGVVIMKGYQSPLQLIGQLERSNIRKRIEYTDYLVHLRFASVGDKIYQNCHPFSVNNKALIHNGTFSALTSEDKTMSDTAIFARMLSNLPSDFDKNDSYSMLIDNYIGTSKIAILSEDGLATTFGKWIQENNVFYSNTYYKKEVTRKNTELPTIWGKK